MRTNSLNSTLYMFEEDGPTTIIEAKIDDTKDLTPEMRAKLLAINERARLRQQKKKTPPGNAPGPAAQ